LILQSVLFIDEVEVEQQLVACMDSRMKKGEEGGGCTCFGLVQKRRNYLLMSTRVFSKIGKKIRAGK
jgi:hypothetical protein